MLNKQTMALAVLVVVGTASYFILKPFLAAILAAAILAIIFRPLYNKLERVFSNGTIRAFVVCAIALIIAITPLFFLGEAVIREVGNFAADMAQQNVSSTQVSLALLGFTQKTINAIPGGSSIDVNAVVLAGLKTVGNWLRIQVIALPNKVLLAVLSLFLFFFLLRDGHELVRFLYDGLPFSRREQNVIENRLSRITYAVVYGQIITAIVQGLVAMLGYWIFGLKGPVIFGLATIIASFIPLFGTAIIWVPASIYLFAIGYASGSWWQGVGLFLYGAIIVNVVDNVVRPWLIGASSRIHPAIALLGVLGGIIVFGFVGIFAGPLILALFITLYDVLIRKVEG